MIPTPAGEPGLARIFDESARRALLALARRAVEAAVRGSDLPRDDSDALPAQPVFGAFVTLRRQGRLRGCMGLLFQDRPAAELVREAARTAALRDPRFEPVRDDELPDLACEVSLLTPLEEIPAGELPGAVRPGLDGLVVESGDRRGLLLPQVAVEQGWDALRFLEQCCAKAGLPKDAWAAGARVSRFTALVIGER